MVLFFWRREIKSQSPSLRGSGRFSFFGISWRCSLRNVSIPFIAGQWSLLALIKSLGVLGILSQSPSLRGSGRFLITPGTRSSAQSASQSPSLRGSGRFTGLFVLANFGSRVVSIPFIAGQWSLRGFLGREPKKSHVSIPFIAGQWSLPSADRARKAAQARLNPLHCGAVVASRPVCVMVAEHPIHVSIPFIAGQWSLRAGRDLRRGDRGRLNPLHCGAVVASVLRTVGCWQAVYGSQSPSLRGSGRFANVRAPGGGGGGRWSQSPSLRGSGRFLARNRDLESKLISSQSPSLRGSGRFERESATGTSRILVSIPFIAGQWSLQEAGQGRI